MRTSNSKVFELLRAMLAPSALFFSWKSMKRSQSDQCASSRERSSARGLMSGERGRLAAGASNFSRHIGRCRVWSNVTACVCARQFQFPRDN